MEDEPTLTSLVQSLVPKPRFDVRFLGPIYFAVQVVKQDELTETIFQSRIQVSQMAASSLVKTRVLIISDTHGYELVGTPDADVVLHCGDLIENGIPEDYEKAIRMLGRINAELKVVIAGNHDLTLDRKFFKSKGGDMSEHQRSLNLWQGSLAKEMKVTLLDEGTHTF
jgi:predicted MPP superfamily phosphohydrolase